VSQLGLQHASIVLTRSRKKYTHVRVNELRQKVWNSLPVSIRESHSLPTFRRNLKTFYFQSAYPTSAAHLA